MLIMGCWTDPIVGYDKLEHYLRYFNIRNEEIVVLGGVFKTINDVFVRNLQNLCADYGVYLYVIPSKTDSLQYHTPVLNRMNHIKNNLIACGSVTLLPFDAIAINGNLDAVFDSDLEGIVDKSYSTIIAPCVPIDVNLTKLIDSAGQTENDRMKMYNIYDTVIKSSVSYYIFPNYIFIHSINSDMVFIGLPPYQLFTI